MSDMTKLANLLACLEIDLVELREVNNTELRLKVQKTVYLMNYLGEKGFDYPFSFYVRGPYSRALALDYYRIDSTRPGIIKNLEVAKQFFSRETSWLELASTMLMVHKDNVGCSNVNEFEIVKNIKPWITLPKFREIINELKAMCIPW